MEKEVRKITAQKMLLDKITKFGFMCCALFSASIILVICVFIISKGVSPFIRSYGMENKVNFSEFILGKTWFVSPNHYGVGFIVINTLYVTFLALFLATPISIFTALFIVKIAPKKLGMLLKYIVEMLASIPSVIYGIFGIGFITKLVKWISSLFNYQSAGGISTAATILLLAIMIIPTITMLSIAAVSSVKKELIHGSLALGASKTQTNFKLVLVGAKSGIISAIILGVGRALGEATAVSMVAGNAGTGPTFHLFKSTRTLTSTMLLGLKETSGLDYDIRFSVGIILVIIILFVNIILNYVKKKIGS